MLFQVLRLATVRSPLTLKGEFGKTRANARVFPNSPFKKWGGEGKTTFALTVEKVVFSPCNLKKNNGILSKMDVVHL
jgi:hypothetical protein